MNDHIREYWETHQAFYANYGHLDEFFRLSDQEKLECFARHEKITNELYPWQRDVFSYDKVKDKTFCEIGVGQGEQFARYMSQRPRIGVAVDYSINAARLTRDRLRISGQNGFIIVADARALPFKNDSFDFVMSCGVLHHIPEAKTAADEILRILDENGEILLMVYNRNSYYYWIITHVWVRCYLLMMNRMPDSIKRGVLRQRPHLKSFILPPGTAISRQVVENASTEKAGAGNPYSVFYTRWGVQHTFGYELKYRFCSRHSQMKYVPDESTASSMVRGLRNMNRYIRQVWFNWVNATFGGVFLFSIIRK